MATRKSSAQNNGNSANQKGAKRKIKRFVGKFTGKDGNVVYTWRDLGVRGVPIFK